ncbi:magnesium transporter CorA family protein [Helcobacillus sp. ACRRO]|uniref:magnesium transporter CorA family protein n=1 Tax=Helcobacillus sp. ACRRO TaxID=2918202 RepID=UPI001EF55E30|nr:magnesium transporter CorA family protein [Helcobacillus sp. ACRRO]
MHTPDEPTDRSRAPRAAADAAADNLALTDARVWRGGECIAAHVSPARLAEELLDDRTVVWADLLDPTAEQLLALAEQLGISPAAVEDALAPHERTKASRSADHIFFTVYGVDVHSMAGEGEVRTELSPARISGFVLPRGLLTIRTTHNGRVFDLEDVVRRWDAAPDLISEGAAALVYGLLDSVVDGHFAVIQDLDDAIEHLEDVLFEEDGTDSDFEQKVYGYRKSLVQLRRVVLPMREVVNTLIRHRGRTGGSLDSWYDDLYDHVLRASEWTESLRDMVSSVFETNLSLQNARLNTIMKQLAAWAALIAIPTAITGWFGQNVPYPGFNNAFGFWLSVALILGLSLGLFALFKKKDWL